MYITSITTTNIIPHTGLKHQFYFIKINTSWYFMHTVYTPHTTKDAAYLQFVYNIHGWDQKLKYDFMA